MDPYFYENQLWKEGFRRIMGLDEVGRGCLAGPVVAAGVILDPDTRIPGIADSKKLGAAQRQTVAEKIKADCVWWTVARCERDEIDSLNILYASLKAMVKCVENTDPPPDYLLVDGNRGIPSTLIPSQTVVGGDGLSASIGAASILAKVYRDELMSSLHKEFPEFGWDRNVGYPTASHYKALQEFGVTPHHRTTFRLGTNRIYRSKPDAKSM
jgi:ribonuclease HII